LATLLLLLLLLAVFPGRGGLLPRFGSVAAVAALDLE
jgi:hypothetical protein